ncbi:MAG: M81 family metallopeptidase, partial [Bryobacteraceae bacterium]
MKIAIASMLQESNTFSPVMTYYNDFSPASGADVITRHMGKFTEMGGFLDVLTKAKAEVVPLSALWAITANRCVKADFERINTEFRQALQGAGPIDGLLLALHGAQTAEGEDDVEGHMLGIAREVLGAERPIVLALDLHANVTPAMVARSTAIVGYHTYPHVDMFETGQKAAKLMLRILRGDVKPAMAICKLPLIVNAENAQTSHGPSHKLIRRAQELEEKGKALAVSVFPVQPWMDIKEMGSAVVVVTDGHAKSAQRHADTLGRKFWDLRRVFEAKLTAVPDAISQALAMDGGPIVLAESSDSTGSGSPGDSTGVLKHLVQAPLTGTAAIYVVDPGAVDTAIRAGIGSTLTMKIGGCFDKRHSKPVTVTGLVRLISDGRWTARTRGYNTGIETTMGRTVVFESGMVRILISERAAMTVDPELYRSHGIEPVYCKIVVVKSPNGFRAAYGPIAKKMFVVDTPGVSTAKLSDLKWKRIPRPMYPFDSDIA